MSSSFFFLGFRDRVSLYSPGCPGTHPVDQADPELRNLPASASQVLELKAFTKTARQHETLNLRVMDLSTTLGTSLGWRDGSVVKSTDCSSRGPEFNSQQPLGGSQPYVMGSDALFWCVRRQLQCTPIHKINISKKKDGTTHI